MILDYKKVLDIKKGRTGLPYGKTTKAGIAGDTRTIFSFIPTEKEDIKKYGLKSVAFSVDDKDDFIKDFNEGNVGNITLEESVITVTVIDDKGEESEIQRNVVSFHKYNTKEQLIKAAKFNSQLSYFETILNQPLTTETLNALQEAL